MMNQTITASDTNTANYCYDPFYTQPYTIYPTYTCSCNCSNRDYDLLKEKIAHLETKLDLILEKIGNAKQVKKPRY